MAKLVGHVLAVVGDTSAIDGPTTVATSNGLGQRNALGSRTFDDAGNEYIYINGVASVVAGDFCFLSQATALTLVRLLNDANTGGSGSVGVAMAALVASTFGWAAVYGQVTTANVATTGAPTTASALYRSATTARASVSTSAKDAIFGAFLVGASVANIGPVYLDYPMVMDQSTL